MAEDVVLIVAEGLARPGAAGDDGETLAVVDPAADLSSLRRLLGAEGPPDGAGRALPTVRAEMAWGAGQREDGMPALLLYAFLPAGTLAIAVPAEVRLGRGRTGHGWDALLAFEPKRLLVIAGDKSAPPEPRFILEAAEPDGLMAALERFFDQVLAASGSDSDGPLSALREYLSSPQAASFAFVPPGS
ncbi:hypothetical protein AB1399_13390 [Hydrogenibacillus schlegelii]|uniref:Uncharacterized protein n=1 Tax=Hydrogenibacillus schlegelii TaxID=1484 RepID=A0A132MG98_HYDSH|nr:hypothetical protein [Hydrogenibacillus schlegelii]KWW96864.1 hypothetical protein TR75_11685 [Hydrogenibacillus schlegelii]OAR05268.1 hypothetical protein SA87_07800 [Hydrogenibacillus schlegelii]